MLTVGVIGPSRRRSGTGPFVARLLHEEGAIVSAVCASTIDSAAAAAAQLTTDLGRPVRAFPSVTTMIADAGIGAVAICTPAADHEEPLTLACEAGLHAFCEKPLVWTEDGDLADRASAIVRMFRDRGCLLHQNTQWRFLLDDLLALAGADPARLRSFEMLMAPPGGGVAMFPEAVPHPVSLLTALGVSGIASTPDASFSEDLGVLDVRFLGERTGLAPLAVRLSLKAQAAQPRPAAVTLDGVRVDREVLSLSPYRLALRVDDRVRPLEDPLRLSVRRFIERAAGSLAKKDDERIVTQYRLLAALWPAVRDAHRARIAGSPTRR